MNAEDKTPDVTESEPNETGSKATRCEGQCEGDHTTPTQRRNWRKLLPIGAGLVLGGLVTFGIVALLVNIFERKQEARDPYFRVAKLDDRTVDPKVWGQNFPIQYDQYLRTTDQEKTLHGGSEALPHQPTASDPRVIVTASKIELDPRLSKMWAGYAFSVDYREKRGHAYMLEDQRDTRRVSEFKQPGACLNCHASTYVLMQDLGNGDLKKGFDEMNKMPYTEVTKLANHPVACIDCHDPKTMQLRITRPAFMEGIKNYKASQGKLDYDVNRDATAQEKRAYVCAQCHVEYYFKGEGKTLTFPWNKGLTVDAEYQHYQEVGFNDWKHKVTGGQMNKAQHPEFELWSQGVHARAGVTCADCHMPYKREGGMKVSDHQVRSPMLNVNNACQGCHKVSEEELKGRVADIQDRHIKARNVSLQALSDLIDEIEKAKQSGVPQERIDPALKYQKKASFYIDWIVSENSNGFHAPGESLRVLNEATDAARKGQIVLAGGKVNDDNAPKPATPASTTPSTSKK